MDWSGIRYFKQREFDSKDAPGSGVKMNMDFIEVLDRIRHTTGRPMKVNSGYRTEAHNKAVGGVPNSAHTQGVAADIACADWGQAFAIVDAAIAFGIKRIGIQESGKYVHLDMALNLPTPRIWFYAD